VLITEKLGKYWNSKALILGLFFGVWCGIDTPFGENKQEASAFEFWKFLGKNIALYLRDEMKG
jgi:hypothetical protein